MMSERRLLIGSLANDLNRVSNSVYRKSAKAATIFWQQAQKWASDLQLIANPKYIERIIADVVQTPLKTSDMAQAEKILMYSILLQNYSLKIE
jgi:hypothetical protein